MINRNTKTLEERVQDLEAEWDIRNLVATYLLKADTRDVEGYAETFAEDGVLDIAGLHFDKVGMEVAAIHEGREAIGKAYSQYIAPVPCFMWHLGHSPHIEVHGGSAVGRWGWTALVHIPLFGPMQAGGVYHDEYVSTDEGWKIKKRVITSWYSMEYGKWNEDMFFGPTQ
jgi:hypothetical protein